MVRFLPEGRSVPSSVHFLLVFVVVLLYVVCFLVLTSLYFHSQQGFCVLPFTSCTYVSIFMRCFYLYMREVIKVINETKRNSTVSHAEIFKVLLLKMKNSPSGVLEEVVLKFLKMSRFACLETFFGH